MNRTRRTAWFTFGMAVLLLAFMGIAYAALFASGDIRAGTRLVKSWAALIVGYAVAAIALARRKQSPAEPEADERDDAIKKNAILASFASVWVSLALASLIPSFVVGDGGSIPVFLLPIINIIVFFIAFLVYSVAVLAQYGTTRPVSGPAKGALS
jgi:hypothetical protein